MESRELWRRSFDALSDRPRRQLLVALLERNADSSLSPFDVLPDATADRNRLQVELHHVHLPKLEAMGFIEWDADASEVFRGPRWERIEPLVRVIHDNREIVPDGWV